MVTADGPTIYVRSHRVSADYDISMVTRTSTTDPFAPATAVPVSCVAASDGASWRSPAGGVDHIAVATK